MSRRKYKNNDRRQPTSERSFQEYILNTPQPQTSRGELLRLIRGGEDTFLELKVKLSNSERIAQGIIALANTAGGVIIFGVNDQLRVEGIDYPETVQKELIRICREEIVPPITPLVDGISFDNGRRIIALEVEGKKPPYRTRDGRYFLRIGAEKREVARDELSNWLDEIRPLGYENVALTNATVNDIDDALLWSFARHFEEDFELKIDYNTGNFLKKDLLLAVGNSDEFVPTIAAILLFGKNEKVAELVPRSVVTAVRYSGVDNKSQIVEQHEFRGNLLTLYDSLMRFVRRYVDLRGKSSVLQTKKTAKIWIGARREYHQDVIAEALVNALIHRDLALREPNTKVLIFDDYIEISNPRRTNGFAPPASRAIRFGVTQRINSQVAAIFCNEGYEVNHSNITLPNLLRLTREFSGKRAEIYTSNDEFKLKVYGA